METRKLRSTITRELAQDLSNQFGAQSILEEALMEEFDKLNPKYIAIQKRILREKKIKRIFKDGL